MGRDPILERLVLDILGRAPRPLTPAEIRDEIEEMGETRAHTTIQTVVTRLWKKGKLERRSHGKTHRYAVVDDPPIDRAKVMAEILEAATDRAAVLTHFLAHLPPAERERIAKELDGP